MCNGTQQGWPAIKPKRRSWMSSYCVLLGFETMKVTMRYPFSICQAWIDLAYAY